MPAVWKTKFIQSHLKASQQHKEGKIELSYCKKERPRPGWAGFARGKGWGSKYTWQKPAVAFRCCYSSSLTVPWRILPDELLLYRSSGSLWSPPLSCPPHSCCLNSVWAHPAGDWRCHCTLWHTLHILGWAWLPFIPIPIPLHLTKAAQCRSLQQEIKTREFSEYSMQEERLRENTTKDKQNFTRVLLRLSLRREGSGDTSLQPSSTQGMLIKMREKDFLHG